MKIEWLHTESSWTMFHDSRISITNSGKNEYLAWDNVLEKEITVQPTIAECMRVAEYYYGVV